MSGSATGSTHRRQARPSEDAHRSAEAPVCWVAVADGHGSERCTRAAAGSALAMDAVAFVLGPLEAVPHPRELVEAVGDRWRDACAQHLRDAPLDPGESAIVRSVDPSVGALLLYGTTLLVAAADQHRLLLTQLGDGDVAARIGGATVRPFGSGDVTGTETESLCQPDRVALTRTTEYAAGSGCPDLVVLATDGFGSAFADPRWHRQVVDDVGAHLAASGPADLDVAIREWCDGPAEVGGDDATLGLLFHESPFRS